MRIITQVVTTFTRVNLWTALMPLLASTPRSGVWLATLPMLAYLYGICLTEKQALLPRRQLWAASEGAALRKRRPLHRHNLQRSCTQGRVLMEHLARADAAPSHPERAKGGALAEILKSRPAHKNRLAVAAAAVGLF